MAILGRWSIYRGLFLYMFHMYFGTKKQRSVYKGGLIIDVIALEGFIYMYMKIYAIADFWKEVLSCMFQSGIFINQLY